MHIRLHLSKTWPRLAAIIASVVIAHEASAQNGPMGIGHPNANEGQVKLLMWYDGSSPTSPVNGNVLMWPDKSGNGHHLSAEPTTSPVLRSNGPNGQPYLEFSKANNCLSLDNVTMGAQGVSVFYVFRTADTQYGMFSFAAAHGEARHLLTQQAGIQMRFTAQGEDQVSQHGNLSNNVWRYAGFVWDGQTEPTYWHRSNGNNNPELTQNNVLSGRNAQATGTVVLGHIQNSLNGGFLAGDDFQGELAEVIVFDGKVNRAQLRLINTYFRNKYDVGGTGSWDKLQAPAAYRNGLIGIGRDNGSNSEQRHSRADGMVLRANPGGIQGNHSYLCAAHNGGLNTVVQTNLPDGVEARWSRDWFVRKSDLGNGSDIQLAFDFEKGIGGEFPSNPDNYVLLYRSGPMGNYSIREVNEVYVQDREVVFRLSGAQVAGNGYYTLASANVALSSLTGEQVRTWYAYQTGLWNNPTTWTLDGSAAPAYVNPGQDLPSQGDAVVIRPGRTVIVDVNNLNHSSLQLGGTIDFASTQGHTFSTIAGNGLIRCAGASGVGNFPAGNTAAFAHPNTGGRVEFYGSGFTQNNPLDLNRLKLNLNHANQSLVLGANLTHHGLLEISKGTFQVHDGAGVSRNIESFGDVLVEAEGKIRVHPLNRSHTWTFHLNLMNEGGEVRFSNRTVPNYTTAENQGHVFARFVNPTAHQRVMANGLTYFSRIVMNKGSDDTYTLSLSADEPDMFRLLGNCNSSMGESPFHAEGSGAQNTSMALINGTLEVRENIFIPLQTGANNFNINETVTLWINGGFAAKGAPDVGTGNNIAIVPYGKIRISAGRLNANCNSGITTRGNGVLHVEGGELNTNQIRTSVFGPSNVGGIIINGGVVNVNGTRPGGVNGSYYTFSLTYPGNLFRMTGGELRVTGPSSRGLIFINSNPEQTSVSGGTVVAEVSNTGNTHRITSRAAFWNLQIERSNTSNTNRAVLITGGDSFGEIIEDSPLYVRNNLTINGSNTPTLSMRSTSNRVLDAHIQGNLIIENGGVYQHFDNTTWFDGNVSSLLYLPQGSTQTFHHVVVQKNGDNRFAEIQRGNGTEAMNVLGDFKLERGFFNNAAFHVSIKGHVLNRSVCGAEEASGWVRLNGTQRQELQSGNGVFHHLAINNTSGISLSGTDLTVKRNLLLENGQFIINRHKLRVMGELQAANPGNNRCIVTNGVVSAGGLEVYFKHAGQTVYFPLAVMSNGVIKYVPAETAINGGLDGAGFIRIVPVEGALPTAHMPHATNYLNFYWKVAISDFGHAPKVSHRFQYNNADVVGNASQLSAGRVLHDAPFERQLDTLNSANDHVNSSTRYIYFNGPDVAQSLNGHGNELLSASYTAGNKEIFAGRPRIFFSRNNLPNAVFNAAANWNELSQFGPNAGVFDYHSDAVSGNTQMPGVGDIVYIGFNPTNGRPHSYQVTIGSAQVSEVRFTPLQDLAGNRQPRYRGSNSSELTIMRPTLSFTSNAAIQDIYAISGEGALLMRSDLNLSTVDIGDFLREDSSIFIVQAPSSLTLNFLPPGLPNLFVTTSINGQSSFGINLSGNTEVRGDLEIVGNARLLLSNEDAGNVTVGRHLRLERYQSTGAAPELCFPNSGAPRNVTVNGDLRLNAAAARIYVLNADDTEPPLAHSITARGNIHQKVGNTTGFHWFTSAAHDRIDLSLAGQGEHSFISSSGLAPQWGYIRMDKGSNLQSSFSFNAQLNAKAPADGELKPIDLRNGLFIVNHAASDVVLSSGGNNFTVPSSAGLQLKAGTLRISGNNIGINLSGRLHIDGGYFKMGDHEGDNNYIEYSSGGTASLIVTGGQLDVASQVRRGLTNTQGVLDYRQSGGLARFGVHAAPSTTRAVFEVLNSGSRFDLTGGAFVLVRGINSANAPSLLLQPTESSIHSSASLAVGHEASPTGAMVKNIGIQSAVALPTLHIDNSAGVDPVVKLHSQALTIEDMLEVDEGATFDTQLFDLHVMGDIHNNGLLRSERGTLILEHMALHTVSGSGQFELNHLRRIGGGVTLCQTPLLVKGDLKMDDGVLNLGAFALTAKGEVRLDGSIESSGGQGLVMSGDRAQTIRRSGPGWTVIDILTTDNPAGINQLAGQGQFFRIDKELRMRRGVLNLNGNLLELGANAQIVQVNAFGQNNMINTGGSFTNFGVRKRVPANSTEDVFMPLGLEKYMPIRLIFSESGYRSGATPSSYLFKLNQPAHPVVLDPGNVLQMYYSIEASTVGANLRMDMELSIDPEYYASSGGNQVADYIGARVVDSNPTPSVLKFFDALNADNNLLVFRYNGVTADGITGDYFAGIEQAIPNNVPVYTTTRNGNVTEGSPNSGTYDNAVPGGGAPNGAVVRIVDNHKLTLNTNGVTLYKTIIEEGATLEVSGTTFHRLGIVEGAGTIRLLNTGLLPAGIYNEFFTCAGGRLQYAGNASYEVLAGIPVVRTLNITGSGNRTIANNDVLICNDFVMEGSNLTNNNLVNVEVGGDMKLSAGTYNSSQGNLKVGGNFELSGTGIFTGGNAGQRLFEGDIIQHGGTFNVGTGGSNILKGNWLRTAGALNSPVGSAKVVFGGSTEQFIKGNFSGSNALRIVEMDNEAGLRLHNDAEISLRLELTKGLIYTGQDSLIRFNGPGVTTLPIAGSRHSYIAGPMQWANLNTSNNRTFPVGKGRHHRPLTLSLRNATRTWTVEYYDTVATVQPNIPHLNPSDPFIIKTVSKQEHWRINSNTPESTQARVGLSWGDNSVVAVDPGDYDKLAVLHWVEDDGVWHSAGANSTTFQFDAINETGSFISQSPIQFSERWITLGSTDAINPLPVTWLSFTGKTDGVYHNLNWSTASEINNDYFELERSVDGRSFTPIARIDGSGNSNTTLHYEYVDRLAPAGRVYYRVRQVDYNGEYEYADEVVTLVKNEVYSDRFDLMVYPNPTSLGYTRLMLSGFEGQMALVHISDLNGRLIAQRTVWIDDQGISQAIPCDYTAGVYIVSVIHEGLMKSKPLIIKN